MQSSTVRPALGTLLQVRTSGRLLAAGALTLVLLCLGLGSIPASHAIVHDAFQEETPKMPSDKDLVYTASANGELDGIPFETAHSPVKQTEIAKDSRISYVEVPGLRSKTILRTLDPRIYVFVSDAPNTHPPFLIRLTQGKDARRVTAVTAPGRAGYAISSNEIVKPRYKVLANQNGWVFMEIRSASPLIEGEYAIMGSDLTRVATFSVGF